MHQNNKEEKIFKFRNGDEMFNFMRENIYHAMELNQSEIITHNIFYLSHLNL